MDKACNIYSDINWTDFSTASEMKPFLTEPSAMYVGAPGKHGYLHMHFEQDNKGRSILRNIDRRVPIIVQQGLYFDEQIPEMPCVYILSSGGQCVDGDRYRQDISIGKGAMAWISTGAATKIAEMKYNYCGMSQHILLEDNAYLEYIPEQIIPCRHSRYISETRLTVAPSATLFYSEIITSGRKYYDKGESFDYDILSIHTIGERPDGEVLFRDKIIIKPNELKLQNIGCMSEYEIYANVIVMTTQPYAKVIFEKVKPLIGSNNQLAIGLTKLPNNAGLQFKVLGNDVSNVKQVVHDFCSEVRQVVKCKPLPPEFPWR